MRYRTKVFPTPISPTRTIVYGTFALFFDVVMMPLLRDATMLEKTVRAIAKMIIVTYLVVMVLSSSSELETFSSSAWTFPPGPKMVLVDAAEKASSLEESSEWYLSTSSRW